MVDESQTADLCCECDGAGKYSFPYLSMSKEVELPTARRAVDVFSSLCRPAPIQNSVAHLLTAADHFPFSDKENPSCRLLHRLKTPESNPTLASRKCICNSVMVILVLEHDNTIPLIPEHDNTLVRLHQ